MAVVRPFRYINPNLLKVGGVRHFRAIGPGLRKGRGVKNIHIDPAVVAWR